MYLKKNAAFTLAEVLITLGIIGVVATFTIPTLVENYQKQVTAMKLKKFYSIMQQAIKTSEVDNGPGNTWYLPSNAADATETWFKTYIAPYIKYTDEQLTASGINVYLADGSKIYIQSGGVYLYFHLSWDSGTNYRKNHFLFLYPTNTSYKEFPNNQVYKFGPYDFLYSTLDRYQRDSWKTDSFNGCNKTNNQPYDCAGLIMIDGWKIADDYPWQ